MKKAILILAILIGRCVLQMGNAYAQSTSETVSNANRLSAGISAGHYRYDAGVAIEFTSRAIFQNHLSLRIRGSIQWLEEYKAKYNQWISYQTFSTGLVYNGKLFDRTRFYAEFGFLGIVPDVRFSGKGFVEGFYQTNGLEVTLLSGRDYTLCLNLGVGPTFVKASAEKIEGNPRYGNGMHFVNGFRVYFGK